MGENLKIWLVVASVMCLVLLGVIAYPVAWDALNESRLENNQVNAALRNAQDACKILQKPRPSLPELVDARESARAAARLADDYQSLVEYAEDRASLKAWELTVADIRTANPDSVLLASASEQYSIALTRLRLSEESQTDSCAILASMDLEPDLVK